LAARKTKNRDRFLHRNTTVEVFSSGSGFLLTVGPVTLLLDRESTEELMCLVADALESDDPLNIAPTGSN
jgi:hypothetical protein